MSSNSNTEVFPESAEKCPKTIRWNYLRESSLLKSCKTANEFIVASYLLRHGPSLRSDIVKATHVKWTTVHDSLVRMQVRDIVKCESIAEGRGRPKVFWSICEC
ncbi:MAG: hypothetical protein ACFFD4_35390 [Candidatus Odinarchaeota archaeon]